MSSDCCSNVLFMFGAATKSVADLFTYQFMRNFKNHNTAKCCCPYVVFLLAALKNSPLLTNTYITTLSFPTFEICVFIYYIVPKCILLPGDSNCLSMY